MNRRKLLKAAGACGRLWRHRRAAIAQSTPALRWRLTTSFPKTLDTLYGACEMFSEGDRRTVGPEIPDQRIRSGRNRAGVSGVRCGATTPSRWATAPPTTTSARIWRLRSALPFRSASTRAR